MVFKNMNQGTKNYSFIFHNCYFSYPVDTTYYELNRDCNFLEHYNFYHIISKANFTVSHKQQLSVSL